MFTSLLLSQLTGGRQPTAQKERFNPCPPGVMKCQSSSHSVYDVLAAQAGCWLSHDQICQLSGRNTKQVCWGLLFLTRQGLVESAPDEYRNPRYLIYRLVPGAPAPKIGGRQ